MTGSMQDSTLREIGAKSGLMGAEVGMTESQLRDALDYQDKEFQLEMADKGYAADMAAAAARSRAGRSSAGGSGGLIQGLTRALGF